MSRRDTIIVAVLLNTGLLAVLFMMAINTDDDRLNPPSEVQQLAVTTPEPIKVPIETDTNVIAMAMPTTTPTSGDELDNVLKDYAANIPPQTIVLDDDNADSIEKEPIQPIEPKAEAKTEKTITTAEKSHTTSDGKTVDVAVKKGDSLDKIARANGTTVDAIKKASNLKNDKLKIGQVLKVPVGSKKAETKVVAKKEETKIIASNETEYYTIQKGDNPWKVAKQFKVKFDDLLKLNNLDEEKARNLKVGDKIRVK